MPTNTTRRTMTRQWELLKLLPTRGSGKSASELTEALNHAGFKVGKRQIERDLGDLMESFPITCNDTSIPYGWKWMEGASADLPGISIAEALSLNLIEDTLKSLLPASILKTLAPRFILAQKKLTMLDAENSSAQWASKVRNTSPTLPLLPPPVSEKVLETVQEGLLLNRQLEVAYQSMSDEELTVKILHPLGLVNVGHISYLVATKSNETQPKLYALHRIAQAHMQDERVKRPSDFKLDDYINAGALQFGNGKLIRLRAKVSASQAGYLAESRLSEDQKIVADGDSYILTASVIESWQLNWYLMSRGTGIEVLAPKALRLRIANAFESAAAQYQ